MSKQDSTRYSLESAYRIGYLLAGYIRNALTEEEARELDTWRRAKESNEKMFQEYTSPANVEKYLEEYEKGSTETYLEKTKTEIRGLKRPDGVRTGWRIAASIAVIIAIAALLIYQRHGNTDPVTGTHVMKDEVIAALKIDGRQTIEITNDFDTIFASGMHLKLNNGELIYQSAVAANHELITPSKGVVKLKLPDGSKVVVNANSSVQYSPVFSPVERRLQLKGEAYFEVAQDKKRPFRVECKEGMIEALGTAFNINAYATGMAFTATLTEGSIKIRAGKRQAILKAGEKVTVNENSFIKSTADTEKATAWSKNEFQFENTPLTEVMSSLSTWYGVEVKYKSIPDKRFSFSISRDSSLSLILSLMQRTKDVQFRMIGDTITVTH